MEGATCGLRYSAAIGRRCSWISPPHGMRSRGHVDPTHAEIRQRVDDGIDHRRRRGDRPGLAAALDAERIVPARHLDGGDVHRRHVGGVRHRVVHERAGEQLPAVVVDGMLHQRLAEALNDAPVHLTGDQHRVDHHPEIVDRHIVDDAGRAGIGVDLHLGDVAAVREGPGVDLGHRPRYRAPARRLRAASWCAPWRRAPGCRSRRSVPDHPETRRRRVRTRCRSPQSRIPAPRSACRARSPGPRRRGSPCPPLSPSASHRCRRPT